MYSDSISKKVLISDEYLKKIKSLHDEKIRQNKIKLSMYDGHYDTDDHGFICFPDFKFKPEYLNGENNLHGARNIGDNLGRFLKEMPVYIYKDSAIAGAWAGPIKNFANIEMPYDIIPEKIQKIHKKYHMWANGIDGMNHMCPDMTIALKKGFKGILNDINYYKNFNNPKNKDFYDGEMAVIIGIIDYLRNHQIYAEQLASKENNINYKNNYIKISQCCKKLISFPPENFRDACQLIAVFQCADRTYFLGGALGQLDELLRPYYEKDIKEGKITDEEVIWILASLFYNDTHYSQIGGRTPDGSRDLTSRISYLILQAAHTLHIPYNLAVRVYDGCDEGLMRRSLEYILEAGSGPSFSLSKGIEEGYVKQGHPIELARMRAKVGCNWVALPGIEYPLQDVTRLNMAWAYQIAFEELMTKEKKDLNELWKLFKKNLKIMVECIKEGYDFHYEQISKYTPEIVLNLFCHGPIERGLNAANGGVDIINLNCDGIALATVADSFSAIEQRVIIDKKLTWEELNEALINNYEGYENIRLMLKNIPRFGSPESLSRKWAEKISKLFTELVISTPTPKHHLKVVPGLFSHGDIFIHGEELPATPNGRKAGEAISHSSEPDPGFANGLMSFSPTLKATAVARVQPGYGNSAPLHLDIDSDMIIKNGGIDTLVALIRTHEQMGGTLINLNCITKDQIRRAHKDPESEPDLVVRVTGYSAFFASLSKEYRQQIVDRYLSGDENN